MQKGCSSSSIRYENIPGERIMYHCECKQRTQLERCVIETQAITAGVVA